MLIPIIKDFNNGFSYLISGSTEKAKEILGPFSKSLPSIVEGQPMGKGIVDKESLGLDIFQISWAIIKIGFLFLIQTLKYIVSFQWLRDFAYLPISIPGNMLKPGGSREIKSLTPEFLNETANSAKNKIAEVPNVLQRYLFANQTIPNSSPPTPNGSYHDFIMGSSHHGEPISSWSLSFLSNDWFDPLTVPVNFLSSQNLSQSSLPGKIMSLGHSEFSMGSNVFQDSNHTISVSHMIIMTILICAATGFSSFFNSFFISFPLSLSNILSLRYLIIQKFLAGCLSILGIVLGEIAFMLCLIVPPPFIQITLVYLESVIPFILGLGLIIFIIFDFFNNPYNNTLSLNQIKSETSGSLNIANTQTRYTSKLSNPLRNSMLKIFGFSFLLSWAEQCCCFSFFGSLNLSSTANFLDTYLFAASSSPLILFFSMIGFFLGSFLAFLIYNLIIAKIIFLSISLGSNAYSYLSNTALSIRQSFNTFDSENRISQPDNMRGFSQNKSIAYLKSLIFVKLPNVIFSFSPITSLSKIYTSVLNFFKKYILNQGNKLFSAKPPYASNQFSTQPPLNDYENLSKISKQKFIWKKTIFFFRNIETFIENKLLQNKSRTIETKTQPESTTPKNALVVNLGSSTLYNKIDKFLLTCLITLSFTTIPYYSFDYLVNSVFGFIPQDQILNAHSLRVNFPDYSNLLGIPLSDNNSVINTDVSLYDRAHFMYGEWPNSFEGLNYQGETMWTNLRDHRRQKRTRRSTRLKFKTLKTKISTSWKEFKQNSGLASSSRDFISTTNKENVSNPNSSNVVDGFSPKSRNNSIETPKSQVNIENSQNPASVLRQCRYDNTCRPNQVKLANEETYNDDTRSGFTRLFSKWFPFNQNGVENFEKRRSNSLSETIKPISSSTFVEQSGGEKYIKSYPKNWKKAIFEKYYQNPIYQSLLSTDIKNFLKREPQTQQLTTNQENELYFLRIKMAHYYDSLRFYFNLKDQIYKPRTKTENFKELNSLSDNSKNTPKFNNESRLNLPIPPFQFKSMTSMNYRQQFKGTLKTVKQLFAISSPSVLNQSSNDLRVPLNSNNETISSNFSSNLISNNSFNPIENSYKYDKYLFNENPYSKSEFLHEEAPNRKSISANTTKPSSSGKISSVSKTIYNMFGSNDPFYVGWDQNLRKFVLTSRILSRASALNHQVSSFDSNQSSSGNSIPKLLNEKNSTNAKPKSVSLYRPYTSWPFFKHQLKNLPNRPYFVLYENYLNILNKKIHNFRNINNNDIDTKSLTFLYSYLFSQGEKRYVSQLPINLYKQAMRPSNLENLFTPTSNARSSFLWPGSVKPTWEYYFW